MRVILSIMWALYAVDAVFAQWVQTNGPSGGNADCFAVMDSVLFVGTYGGGVYRSTNNGASWSAVNSGLGEARVYALAVSSDGVGGNNLFAGTAGAGVFRSTNKGADWSAVNSGLTNTLVLALGAAPNSTGGTNLYAGTYFGVFRSTDNGTNWVEISGGLPPNKWVTALAVVPNGTGGTNLFVGSYTNGIYLYINAENRWAQVSLGFPSPYNGVQCFAVQGTTLYAGLYNAVFRSTNNGTNWDFMKTGLPDVEDVLSLVVKDSSVFAGTDGAGVFIHNDKDTSWIPMSAGINNLHVTALVVDGSDIFAGSDGGGVFRSSNNGSSWTEVSTGITNTHVTSFAVKNTNLFAGTDGRGVFASSDQGGSWTSISAGLGSRFVLSLAMKDTNIFAGTDANGVFLSTNGGSSWIEVNSGLLSSPYDRKSVYSLVFKDNYLFAGTRQGLFVSTNNGTSWSASSLIWAVTSLAVDGAKVLAGTLGRGIFLSTDNGASWTESNSGLSINDIYALAVQTTSAGTSVLAGSGGGVFLSTNGGASWNATPLISAQIRSLATSATNVFAGTYGGGVFLSTDNGSSWSNISTGFENISFATYGTNIFALCFVGESIFSGTYMGGAWKRSLSQLITAMDDRSVNIPTKISLSQNYPNPFNPVTTISFTLPTRSFVSLKVFDMLGRQLSILISEEMSAGIHNCQLKSHGLRSGVYFYRLEAGSFVETKKIVLLK